MFLTHYLASGTGVFINKRRHNDAQKIQKPSQYSLVGLNPASDRLAPTIKLV